MNHNARHDSQQIAIVPASRGRFAKRLVVTLSLGVAALVGAACGPAFVSGGFDSGPPAPSYQNIYYEGRDGYVWVEGRYDWTGSDWQWRPGAWVLARPGYVYIQGYWEQSDGRWVWVGPYWAEQRNGYVHVRGYWMMSGGQRVWAPGRWEAQRPGHIWVRGSWHTDRSRQQWQRGHWSQPRTTPYPGRRR